MTERTAYLVGHRAYLKDDYVDEDNSLLENLKQIEYENTGDRYLVYCDSSDEVEPYLFIVSDSVISDIRNAEIMNQNQIESFHKFFMDHLTIKKETYKDDFSKYVNYDQDEIENIYVVGCDECIFFGKGNDQETDISATTINEQMGGNHDWEFYKKKYNIYKQKVHK